MSKIGARHSGGSISAQSATGSVVAAMSQANPLKQPPERSRGGHAVRLDQVSHHFGSVMAVDGVSLDIAPGALVALLGPSGCGKTTLLRALAGFVVPTRGSILIDGQDVTDDPPNVRNVGIVFQNYALFPHMTVADNVGYGLAARRTPRREVQERVGAMLELVRLGNLASRYPRELSGGQQQRVALARVLSVQPRVLLLDEPLSALDRGLRLDMQIEIRRLQRDLGITTILVTHDQEEAMSMADRIAVMNAGRVLQFDRPMVIYDRPADLFVNEFIGSTNLLPGRTIGFEDGLLAIQLDSGALVRVRAHRDFPPGASVVVSVRPERLLPCNVAPDALGGRVIMAMPLGSSMLYDVVLADGANIKLVVARAAEAVGLEDGAPINLRLATPDSVSVFARPST
jgi:putative spermidine/putrescine transport system ATP-binding protein